MPPTPQSNVERYLSVIAGHGGETPSEPASRVEWYLKEIVEQGGIGGKLKPRPVAELPAVGESGILYLVPVRDSSGQNTHDEYFWVEEESKYELLGQANIEIDLSGLVPDTRKVGNVPLSADIPVTLTGDAAITVTNTGASSAIGYGVSHNDSGVTAGSKGDTTAQTPGFGDTFKAMSATVDAKGHVTALEEHTVKIPDAEATQSAKGLMSPADKAKLDSLSIGAESLVLQSALPANVLIADDTGKPGVYVERPAMSLGELLGVSETAPHPAFLYGADGATVKGSAFFGKYLASVADNRAYSLPRVDPANSLSFDAALQYCRNKGAGHHLITAAEWGFLALLAKRRGTMPKGNNNNGKDASESLYLAIPTRKDGTTGQTYRTATGTGPLAWSDTGDATGVMDLNGNAWEWIAGMRLVRGELQFIPYNNAAGPTVDMGATSTAWKAINATATGYGDLYVTPNGAGTTSGSVKLDFVPNHWQWAPSAASVADRRLNAAFAGTTASGLSDFCKMYLRAMALLPEDDGTDYGGNAFWANNGAEEALPFRGGNFGSGAGGGVFANHFDQPRSTIDWGVGFRAAFADV